MDIGSVSQQLNSLMQTGGDSALGGALSPKSLMNIAQGGMQSAEAFSNDLTSLLKANGVKLGAMPSIQPKSISPTGSLEGIKNLGKHFLDTTNASLVLAQQEQAKVISGESTSIHQSILSAHEANAQLNVCIHFANKLQEFYKTVAQTQV